MADTKVSTLMYSDELRAIRERLCWSQSKIARALGIRTDSYSRLERGAHRVSETLIRLARTL